MTTKITKETDLKTDSTDLIIPKEKESDVSNFIESIKNENTFEEANQIIYHTAMLAFEALAMRDPKLAADILEPFIHDQMILLSKTRSQEVLDALREGRKQGIKDMQILQDISDNEFKEYYRKIKTLDALFEISQHMIIGEVYSQKVDIFDNIIGVCFIVFPGNKIEKDLLTSLQKKIKPPIKLIIYQKDSDFDASHPSAKYMAEYFPNIKNIKDIQSVPIFSDEDAPKGYMLYGLSEKEKDNENNDVLKCQLRRLFQAKYPHIISEAILVKEREELQKQINNLKDNDIEKGELIKELKKLVYVDTLTGVPNRRRFEEEIKRHISHSKRANIDTSCSMEKAKNMYAFVLDIDHFKKFNDTYGHDVGDEVLKVVANTAAKECRDTDIFARCGGEEFYGILPETKEEGSFIVLERIREKIAAIDVAKVVRESSIERTVIIPESERITISIGAAKFIYNPNSPDKSDTPETLTARADFMLYRVKKTEVNGKTRNRVEIASSKIIEEDPEYVSKKVTEAIELLPR